MGGKYLEWAEGRENGYEWINICSKVRKKLRRAKEGTKKSKSDKKKCGWSQEQLGVVLRQL